MLKSENSVLKALAWFDMFNYPLTLAEIHFFLDQTTGRDELETLLQEMVAGKMLYRMADFYSLQHDEALAIRRVRGNQHAQRLLTIAHRVSKLLYHFPYVRGIGISGSLSKNFADENADIDFFIITSANRLWIARTAMHLLKKFSYLLGKQHWLCMNYYIDEEALLINEQNIFTATELITLMPVCGNGAVSDFFYVNNWSRHYYPNYSIKTPLYNDPGKGYRMKKFLEYIFNNRLGDRLDDYFMKVTTRRWKEKEEKHRLNMRGGRMGLSTGKHFSKPKPGFFQKDILEKYQQKLDSVYAKWNKLHAARHEL